MELPDGMVYRVHHQRSLNGPGHEWPLDLKTRGGKTVVEIGHVEEVHGIKTFTPVVTGIAVCSSRDTYNKKRGRDIALGRALKQLGG